MENKENFEHTILTTPKPSAASTAQKKKNRPRSPNESSNSLGILSLNSIDTSFNLPSGKDEAADYIQRQRLYANESLQRASITSLPSKYFKPKPNLTKTLHDTNYLSSSSTINESDFLSEPINNSTPRQSVVDSGARMSLSDIMNHLSNQLRNSEYSMEEITNKFGKVLQAPANEIEDSSLFIPGEDAAYKIAQDEESWRRKNDVIPGPTTTIDLSESLGTDQVKMSMGEFFKMKSEDLSNLVKETSIKQHHQPVPLIDVEASLYRNESPEKANKKSLSVSAIAALLSQSSCSPNKMINYLYNQQERPKEEELDDTVSFRIPSSKDTSASTQFSENAAIKDIINQDISKSSNFKTEMNVESISPMSSASGRTSSCLSSLPNGKLPIESTKNEIIWGCVKLGKVVTQEFLLRNKSSKTIRLQCNVKNHYYKLKAEGRGDGDSTGSVKMVLRAFESRPIIVSFAPTKIGACIDEICFTSLDPNLEQTRKQCVMLYGYGGFGRLTFENIYKELSGRDCLHMGEILSNPVLEQTVIISNTGTLPCFFYAKFNSKSVLKFDNVEVTPSFFVLIPKEKKSIVVRYTSSSEDLKFMQNGATLLELGILNVVYGTEVNRGRLRRLCRKASEKNTAVDELSNALKERIRGEVMPSDLGRFKESLNSFKDILKLFEYKDIILTLRRDPDQTLVPQYEDDSALYTTLTHDNFQTIMENTVVREGCRLQPSNILLTPPIKTEDCLILQSESSVKLHFALGSVPEGFAVVPKEGYLNPKSMIILKVSCVRKNVRNESFKLMVHLDTEVLEAVVDVVVIGSQ